MHLPIHRIGNVDIPLGLLLPTDGVPTRCKSVLEAPGFNVWTRDQITEAVKRKPYKKRDVLRGLNWSINQRRLGSCNCAAGTRALRTAMFLGGRNDIPLLSWEFMYAQLVDGRDNGSMLDDGMHELENTGVPILDTGRHPINRDYRKRDYTAEEYAEAKLFRAENTYQLSVGMQGELELATALLSGQAAGVVAVDVGNNFGDLTRDGFVQDGGGPGNHAVCVDDVDIISGEIAFDMPNSWGEEWGDNGRGMLSYQRTFRRTMREHGFYVIFGTTNPGEGAPRVG